MEKISIDDLCAQLNENSLNKLAFFKDGLCVTKDVRFFEAFYKGEIFKFGSFTTQYMVEYLVSIFDKVDRNKIVDILKSNFNTLPLSFSVCDVVPLLDRLTLEEIERIEIPDKYFKEYANIGVYLTRRFIKPESKLLCKALDSIINKTDFYLGVNVG